jgi:hypothetical protein
MYTTKIESNPWITANEYPQEIVEMNRALSENPNIVSEILWNNPILLQISTLHKENSGETLSINSFPDIQIPSNTWENFFINSAELKQLLALAIIKIMNTW